MYAVNGLRHVSVELIFLDSMTINRLHLLCDSYRIVYVEILTMVGLSFSLDVVGISMDPDSGSGMYETECTGGQIYKTDCPAS